MTPTVESLQRKALEAVEAVRIAPHGCKEAAKRRLKRANFEALKAEVGYLAGAKTEQARKDLA